MNGKYGRLHFTYNIDLSPTQGMREGDLDDASATVHGDDLASDVGRGI